MIHNAVSFLQRWSVNLVFESKWTKHLKKFKICSISCHIRLVHPTLFQAASNWCAGPFKFEFAHWQCKKLPALHITVRDHKQLCMWLGNKNVHCHPRDPIKIIFDEYGNNILVYYSLFVLLAVVRFKWSYGFLPVSCLEICKRNLVATYQ
jgi:hypothetical protein